MKTGEFAEIKCVLTTKLKQKKLNSNLLIKTPKTKKLNSNLLIKTPTMYVALVKVVMT